MTPEIKIQTQRSLSADLILEFDEYLLINTFVRKEEYYEFMNSFNEWFERAHQYKQYYF